MGNAVSEGRFASSMYLSVLSGALVAMGFATQAENIFVPFVATVLPAIFVMGVFTVLRLVDVSVESTMAEVSIARIRRYYRELDGNAAEVFDTRMGRWPEKAPNPSLRLGAFFGYWTSAASMITAINALVGAAWLTLLLNLVLGLNLPIAIVTGLLAALAMLFLFHQLQKMRIAETDRFSRDVAGINPTY